MSRYARSFGIALLPYVLGIGAYVYVQSIVLAPMEQKTVLKAMAIQISCLPPKPVVQESEAKIEEPKELPKVEEKPLPKPPKIVKKKSEPKKVEPPITPSVQTPIVSEKVVQKEEHEEITREKSVEKVVEQESLHVKQERYFTELKNRIDANKTYPRFARERNIEGSVLVEFTISPEGKLLSYAIVEGKQVFHKSVKEAIQKSFPFPMRESLFSSNLTVTLTIGYTLI